MLLTFKIPYYIGPINDTHKKRFPDRCWVVKKENTKKEKITPWNFYDYIDKEKTAEAFITVRTNKCTYLIGEDVLPRYSLLYSEYTVLNELNNLKININGSEICTVELKRRIYDGLFKKKKKVSRYDIEQKFDMSSSSVSRLLKSLTENGIILKDGKGKNTQYIPS